MVIIHTKTLEKKKAADDVTSWDSSLEPRGPLTMTQGTALFSRGGSDSGVWADLGRCFTIQKGVAGTSLDSLWDAGTAGSITSLIRDLKLSEGKVAPSQTATVPAAPPTKRQCRSLSCSDEPGSTGTRPIWRPQGSRVWTAVEKRRCHSGGSVQRGMGQTASRFPAMQRSSSFSLPSHAKGLPELACFSFTCVPSMEPQHTLHLSQEQIGPPGGQEASPASSPDSTPELVRWTGAGGLSRSRSQPCVLNDRKISMKRRRPEELQEQRPSLDLAKMTQKLAFYSLSCPRITEPCSSCSAQSSTATGHEHGTELWHGGRDDSSGEEADGDSAGAEDGRDGGMLWQGASGSRTDVNQLGGELDIEQIERN